MDNTATLTWFSGNYGSIMQAFALQNKIIALGYNNDIATAIKGLYILGDKAEHSQVKRTVFHIINILSKEKEYEL